MKVSEIKERLAMNVLALDSLMGGDIKPATEAIQLGDLPEDKLRYGLTERIKADYGYLTSTRRNVAASLTGSAVTVLGGSRLAPSAKQLLTEIVS